MFAIETRGLTKSFGSLVANNQISLNVKKGEVLALLGENGAGKSTLMNLLYGLYAPDAGEIYVDGKKATIKSPKDAIDLGIGMVHQHFMLVPAHSVADNVVLGMRKKTGMVLSQKEIHQDVRAFFQKYNFDLDPAKKVGELPVGLQQRVEILKALYRGAKVLILDEPTAVLTPQEIKELFKIICQLQSEGKSVIFISHKLDEVMEISQRVTVLRLGAVVATVETAATDAETLARMMIGRDLVRQTDNRPFIPGKPKLKIKDLTVERDGKIACKGLTFEVYGGEILGIAGVDGNGQKELVEAITGLIPIKAGQVLLDNQNISAKAPKQVIDAGIAHIPEDRQARGLVMDFSIAENLILETHDQLPFKKGIFLDEKIINDYADELISTFRIKTDGRTALASSLSGGNQQKVIFAREISRNPEVLIAMKPTRGLDVGAIEYVHKRLMEERNKGKAILLVSTELEEILALSDRIAVMHEGKFTGLVWPDISEGDIGQLMAGVKESFVAKQPKKGGEPNAVV